MGSRKNTITVMSVCLPVNISFVDQQVTSIYGNTTMSFINFPQNLSDQDPAQHYQAHVHTTHQLTSLLILPKELTIFLLQSSLRPVFWFRPGFDRCHNKIHFTSYFTNNVFPKCVHIHMLTIKLI